MLDKAHRWALGESGTPPERPSLSTVLPRQQLQEAFIGNLAANFERDGAKTIAAAREKNPLAYLKMIAGLVPKDVAHQVGGKIEYTMDITGEPQCDVEPA